ncbi:Aste57867_11900 [Aphanomyces stellatus]|uniref:Palmitoyl-protein thioesterase 1 n=1 Tax=Aphanomyces stellatus TaxID=120398 RepID=A0A485KUT4_9STRA|nr:hypothetical protein As57867_011855 [Aphanomyces stellatus]VFT88755.1 Aste57867_11900 [Aphanomyces stellatus]
MRVDLVSCLTLAGSWVVAAASHGPAVWNPESFTVDSRMIFDLEDGSSFRLDDVPLPATSTNLPTIIMHGMGDAAQNPGMQRFRKAVEKSTGNYATNIQIGASQAEDTSNGFFMKLDKQVDYFAKVVAEDEKLRHGFNAMGFSQGNLVIRGYIQRYNQPPVLNFIAVHGPMAGVGALPHCKPVNVVCKTINSMISYAAYADSIQQSVAQANYFRDPIRISEYLEHALFLPDINNEKPTKNATYKKNFIQLNHLHLVRASKDTMVYPHASEWFGAYADGNFSETLSMNETTWYKEDSFGLQSLDKAGKISLAETAGDHLQIPTATLLKWIEQYFTS